VLEPLDPHVLLPFIVELFLLLLVARLLGEGARRIGLPAVVGELGAGLLLGPSVFGRVAPGLSGFVFPDGAIEGSLVLGVAQLGVLFLLVTTGFETDLQLLGRLGRPAVTTSAASLAVPLVAGYAVGSVLPATFVGTSGGRANFAMFIAVAISISALAVAGRILTEMGLMRRDIGQIIVGVAMANELVGWILLGLLTGIAVSGSVDVAELARTVGALALFLALALTLGRRVVDRSLRGLRTAGTGSAGALTATVLFALAAAAITQAIGVEAALGAFVAGVVLGGSRYQDAEALQTLERITQNVFAPIFFATAGIFVDVGALVTRQGMLWFGVLLTVAIAAKFVGAYAGTRWGGRDHATAVAMGVGLNARGTLEIVLATIALSIGVFNTVSYSAVVLVAMVSALATPPLLRMALRRVTPPADEAERLERELLLSQSVIASVDRALVPTRGGANSELAAQTLDLVLQPEASVTVLTVHGPEHDPATCGCEAALDGAAAHLGRRDIERRRAVAATPAAAVLKEAGLGYGLLTLGMTEGFRDSHQLSPTLRELLVSSEIPVLLVRHGATDARPPADYRRLVVPATGTRMARAAEEIAATLASRTDGTIDLVHVVPRPDRDAAAGSAAGATAARDTGAGTARMSTHLSGPASRSAGELPTAQGLLARAMARVDQFGVVAEGHIRQGVRPYEGVQHVADAVGADAIFLGTEVRSLEGQPFLGHGTEYLLEHAHQTVLVLVFPAADEPS
jgi:Kef-type K+ transport system membrane component KefB/nucleotide-binding universal stress UspA family protein